MIAEVDFSNAFNSVERSAIAKEVAEHFPILNTWFALIYGKPTNLIVRNQPAIKSERGVQQGDPLGPFLFALALQPALKMAAESGACVLAYLDDVYVCGRRENVISVIEALIEETQKIR